MRIMRMKKKAAAVIMHFLLPLFLFTFYSSIIISTYHSLMSASRPDPSRREDGPPLPHQGHPSFAAFNIYVILFASEQTIKQASNMNLYQCSWLASI